MIEVLLAILLFWSWIVVILSIIIQNISLAQRIQDKTVATMLAKEAIEMFYSYKDTNIDKWEYWDVWNGTFFDTNPGSVYCVQKIDNWDITIQNCNDVNQQRLLEYNVSSIPWWAIFQYDAGSPLGWVQSKFIRYCKFSELNWANLTPTKLARSTGWWHLAMQIDCTVETVSQSLASRKVRVTLSSIIWQNRE